MVFVSVCDATNYALELNELVMDRDWEAAGLPGDMDLRVALHCGPVFCGTDPITGLAMYTGPHTSRTARIEPITPPGQVYASSAFAAAAVAQSVGGVRFRYMGRTPLAKKYGSLELYHVGRQNKTKASRSKDDA
jgi:class 3 adenylate cyclase